jgi:ribosomal protein S18 acetylase RimI-like enzyme
MTKDYKIIKRAPSYEEYKAICIGVGWEEFMNFEVSEKALKNSLYAAVITFNEEIVGMGRIVGDGQIYLYIQDIAVLPEHQKRGVGKMIMEHLMEYLNENAPEKAFIGLFAAQGTLSFYNKYGLNQYDGLIGIFGVSPVFKKIENQ